MWLTKLALARPVTVSMIFVCAVVLGLVSSRLIPLEFFPQVQFPGVFVQVNYPGSSPDEVEKNITKPIEEALATMGGVERMQSTSTESQSSIFMLFDWALNAKLKGVDAREKIDNIRSQLPSDVRRVFIFTGSTNDQPVVEARLSATTDLADSWQVLNRQLKQRLERIPGVSKVAIHGVAPKTYQIQLDATKLAAYHLDSRALLNQLQQSNSLIDAGEIKNPHQNIRVTLNQQFKSKDDIANFIINSKGLKLSDVADIKFENDEIDVGRHLDQKYAVGISITREAGSNLVETSRNIVKELKKIESLPDFEGINLFIMENQGDGVVQSLSDMAWSGFVGFILSSLVLFYFLRDVRLTLIVSLAVPFSLMITLAVMYLTNITLNILSMMGLMLAIGMLVDNSVVISESIFGYREKMPDKPIEAALNGVRDVGLPVIAGTLTTAIVFLPNVIGKKVNLTVFLGHVAMTIIISLLASLFIATTIIPLLLSKMKSKAKPIAEEEPEKKHGHYSALLSWMMNHPKWSTLITLGFIFSVAIPAPFVKMDQGGQNEQLRLFISYNINGEYQLDRVEKSVTRIEKFLYANKDELDIDNVYSYFTKNDAGSTLLLKDKTLRKHRVEEIKSFVEKNMPKLAIGKPGFDRNGNNPQNEFSIFLKGDDTQTLNELSQQITPLLESIKGVVQVLHTNDSLQQEVRVVLNPQRLQQLGLSPANVAQTISIGMRKQQLRTFRGENGEIDITLSFQGQDTATLSHLAALPIELPNNKRTRLDSVAELRVAKSTPQITHIDRQTGVNLKISYDDQKTNSEDLKKIVSAIMENTQFPLAYSWSFGQGVSRSDEQNHIMVTNMLLAVMMIFIVMAALFESLILPLAIITSIIYAIVGVFWYFFLTGTNMSIMGMIGILVLMGVVVNNGIVLIDRIKYYREQGFHKQDAILHAANDRIRPILMTVLTTILGLLPLSLGDATVGGGGPPYYPMARAVIGGLGYSTIATLICLPMIYLFLDGLRIFYGNLWNSTFNPKKNWTVKRGVLQTKN